MRREIVMLVGLLLALFAPRPARAIDIMAERRQQVEAMSADEKDALRDKFAKFEALPPGDQEQLRRLHEQLDSDPQGEKLRRTMTRYHEWLKTLSPSDRADLLALPPEGRLARIKTLRDDQAARAASQAGSARLVGSDVIALTHWVEQFASDHEAELLKSLAPRRRDLKNLDDAKRRKVVTQTAWQHWRTGNKLPFVSDAEISRLAEQLSPEARAALERQVVKADRIQMIHDWAQAISRVRSAAGLAGKQIPLASDEEFSRFFQQDLTQAQRDRIMEMPRDEMHRELRKLFLQRQHPAESAPSSDKKSVGT